MPLESAAKAKKTHAHSQTESPSVLQHTHHMVVSQTGVPIEQPEAHTFSGTKWAAKERKVVHRRKHLLKRERILFGSIQSVSGFSIRASAQYSVAVDGAWWKLWS
jgi:hypothetical protein